MLRLKGATSDVADFTSGSFEPVIDDARVTNPAAVRRVLLHAGKIHYDLLAEQEKLSNASEFALVRLEQYYPVPVAEIQAIDARYPGAEFVWIQDEPENQGAWPFVNQEVAKHVDRPIRVISRPSSAATATGLPKRHAAEHTVLMDAAFAI